MGREMNCKKGDMAVIIKSVAGNTGKVVTCLKQVGRLEGWSEKDYWIIDREIPTNLGRTNHYISDSYLMPIGRKSKDKNIVDELTLIQ